MKAPTLAAALAISVPTPCADWIVGPGGFADVHQAIEAASDGDRILLRQSVLDDFRGIFSIDKSLTFVGDEVGSARTFWGALVSSVVATESCTFRNIAFVFQRTDGTNLSMFVSGAQSVVFDNCSLEMAWSDVAMVDDAILTVVAPKLSLRNCDVRVVSQQTHVAGFAHGLPGIGAVFAKVGELLLEDCVLAAGDGMINTSGGAMDTGAPGGRALWTNAPRAQFVRTTFEDGDGSYAESGFPAASTYNPAPGGASDFGARPSFYACSWTPGLEGLATDPHVVQMPGEPTASLTLTGGELGGTLTATYPLSTEPPIPLGFVIGFGHDTIDFGAFGVMAIDGFAQGYLLSGSPHGGVVDWAVPMHGGLQGAMVIVQSVLTAPLRFGNPSHVRLRLP